jgi:hypothetical protein
MKEGLKIILAYRCTHIYEKQTEYNHTLPQEELKRKTTYAVGIAGEYSSADNCWTNIHALFRETFDIFCSISKSVFIDFKIILK